MNAREVIARAKNEDYADVSGQELRARALAAAKGFIYWPGGKEAPTDWDGGPYLCRDGKTYHMCGYDWGHGTYCWNPTASWDRIGYRAMTPAAAKDQPDG